MEKKAAGRVLIFSSLLPYRSDVREGKEGKRGGEGREKAHEEKERGGKREEKTLGPQSLSLTILVFFAQGEKKERRKRGRRG